MRQIFECIDDVNAVEALHITRWVFYEAGCDKQRQMNKEEFFRVLKRHPVLLDGPPLRPCAPRPSMSVQRTCCAHVALSRSTP